MSNFLTNLPANVVQSDSFATVKQSFQSEPIIQAPRPI